MTLRQAPLPSYSQVVEYDPGDAVGFPAQMPLEEAISCWRHDMAYLQTLLDTAVKSQVEKWPAILCDGEQVPTWKVCEMANLSR